MLVSSWTLRDKWETDIPIRLKHCWPSWSLQGAASRVSRVRYLSRLAKVFYDRLPPTVEVQVRPGAIEFANSLREEGHQLAMVTASERSRVEFLKKYMPSLFQPFETKSGLNVFCAEDLIAGTQAMLNQPNNHSKLNLHHSLAPSLAHKTPDLITQLMPAWNGYDWLIDDSHETRNVFEKHGLSDCLIAVDGCSHPLSNLFVNVKREIEFRIGNKTEPARKWQYSTIVTGDQLETPSVIERLLDPMYLPTLRRSLSFELTES